MTDADSSLSRRRLLAAASGAVSAGVLGYAYARDDRDLSSVVGAEPDRVVDIRDYGAVGDGRTDDSGALTDAIEAADPGDTVVVPESDAPYLLSFEGTGQESAIELGSATELRDITITGETPAAGAQTLQVEPGSYDPTTLNWVLRLNAERVIDGFRLRNLTIDGARPPDDAPAGLGGEAAVVGILLRQGRARGGHDIAVENCLVRNCSASATRFEESGVTCRRVTATRAGRHGFNPVAEDTVVDPGFYGQSLKAVDCDGTGIDHRHGTAVVEDVYTENNRSGNKWKHSVERLVVRNHHSVRDRNHGWRSNHSHAADQDAPPETQWIVLEGVFVEEPEISGVRVSGTDTRIHCEFRDVEVRQTAIDPTVAADAGITFYRDVTTPSRDPSRVVVAGTDGGYGVSVSLGATLNAATFEHAANDAGPYRTASGTFTYEELSNTDPGRNVFATPARDAVGAFTD